MFRKLIVAGALIGALAAPASASAFNAERYAGAYTFKYEDVRAVFTDCYKSARKTWICTVRGQEDAHEGTYGDWVKMRVKIKHNYKGWYWYGWTLSRRHTSGY